MPCTRYARMVSLAGGCTLCDLHNDLAVCGTGTLACWNHPFEVARIEAQARGDQNQKNLNMVQIFRMIVKEQACVPLDPTCPALMQSPPLLESVGFSLLISICQC